VDHVRGIWKAGILVAVALVLSVASGAATASASRGTIPVGRYVGRTTQHLPLAFDFVTKKGIVPQLDPSVSALYNFAATTTFRCNHGGNVRRRVFFAVGITDATGTFDEGPGSGTTLIRGERQVFSFRGRLRPNGQASGSFEQTITNIWNTKGRVCTTGTIGWTAKLQQR
jgi:hypothetical protein